MDAAQKPTLRPAPSHGSSSTPPEEPYALRSPDRPFRATNHHWDASYPPVGGVRAPGGPPGLQNRCEGESSQAGSIPVRLRYGIRALTSADVHARLQGAAGETGSEAPKKP